MFIILAHHTIIRFENAVTIEDWLADETGEQRVANRWVYSSTSTSSSGSGSSSSSSGSGSGSGRGQMTWQRSNSCRLCCVRWQNSKGSCHCRRLKQRPLL
jgi:hypothetical protein